MRIILSILCLVAWTARADLPAGDYVVVMNGRIHPRVVAREHGVGPKKQWTNAIHGFAARLTAEQASKLERDTRVEIIEPDITVSTCAQTTPTGIKRIGGLTNTVAAIDGVDTRVDVDVAVIDTGIDLTHPDLNVYRNVTFVTGTTTGNDDNGHGSHVAGTIGALDNSFGVVGVAPGCRLWAVKVLSSTGSGSMSQIISGVDYVTANAASIEVANMSLGGRGTSDALRAAIQACVARGVVIVVAAGNSGFEVYGGDDTFNTYDDFLPACFPEVMTVSALADSDGITGALGPSMTTLSYVSEDDTMATFSNWAKGVVSNNPVQSPGAAIDIMAPGVNIYSTTKNGTYTTMSGTSMACPHVAGAVALYIAANARATTASGVYAIRQAIINGGVLPPWGNANHNPHPFMDKYDEPMLEVSWIVGGGSPPATPLNYYPTISISQPTSGKSVPQGTAIVFAGSASDIEDGDLSSSISWSDSISGALGVGATLSTAALAVGSHTVTASITDSGSLNSTANVTVSITSTNPPPATPSLTVTVTANKVVYVNKEKALISALVKSGTANVSAATCTFQVRGASGQVTTKTVTTTSTGVASFYLPIQINKMGAGTATVTCNASKTSYLSGQSTTTFAVR